MERTWYWDKIIPCNDPGIYSNANWKNLVLIVLLEDHRQNKKKSLMAFRPNGLKAFVYLDKNFQIESMLEHFQKRFL